MIYFCCSITTIAVKSPSIGTEESIETKGSKIRLEDLLSIASMCDDSGLT